MREARSRRKQAASPVDGLNPCEPEILKSRVAGLSKQEIGAQLFLSEKMVKHYMTKVLQKLNVRNRVDAALLEQKATKRS